MSLEKLCLAAVAESIHRHRNAYSSTYNKDLPPMFHLLQRLYTPQILLWLVERKRLREKHADLVFNKYLKSLDTRWISKFSWDATERIFARIGPSLEKVDFFGFGHDVEMCEDVICHLPNVKSITYQHSCDDVILQRIAECCPRLEVLDVKYSEDVTDVGLEYLCEMKKEIKKSRERECHTRVEIVPCRLLKEIYILYTDVDSTCVRKLLKKLPLLEKIDCSDLPIILYSNYTRAHAPLDTVERYNLTHLHLNFSHIRGFGICEYKIVNACVALCPNLKSLDIGIYSLEDLNVCSVFTDIEDLSLCCCFENGICDFSDVSDFLKKKGGQLKFLDLCNCTLSFSVLEELCRRLNRLTVINANIQYNETNSTTVFCNLREFTVEPRPLISDDIKYIFRILRSSPVLEKLQMGCTCKMTSEMKSEILKCSEQSPLKCIELRCDADPHFLKDILLACSTLETLRFKRRCLTPALIRNIYTTAKCVLNRPKVFPSDF